MSTVIPRVFPNPKYTGRLLITAVESVDGKDLLSELRKHSHCTILRTQEDLADEVKKKFGSIACQRKNESLVWIGDAVVQFGLPTRPVWVLHLREPEGLRPLLSKELDPIMEPEQNGLFLWLKDSKRDGFVREDEFHLTFGPTEEDRQRALSFVNCRFYSNQMDYKKVGPCDPHVVVMLE